jgi:hypothetical protein
VEIQCCTPLIIWKGKEYNLHDIPLPKWITWTDEEFGETNLQEYLGDVGNIFHQYIIWPIQQWCWKQRTSDWMVPVPWVLLKPHQPKSTVDWVEKTIAEWTEWEAKEKARDLATAAESNTDPGSDPQQPEVYS